ncbi:MAG: M20/M25/M40 family metallo-hydrolase [Pseudomonadota bacterium]
MGIPDKESGDASDIEVWQTISRMSARAVSETEALLLALLAQPSPNPPGDTRGLADVIEDFVADLPGVDCQRVVTDELIHNLIITLKGTGAGRRLVLNGHLDTFPLANPDAWKRDPKGECAEGNIFGLGVSDMKGGLAAALQCLKILSKCRSAFAGELVLAFAGDEEGAGKLGMEYLLENHPETIGDAVVTVDAGSPEVLRFGEKGAIWMELSVKSKPFHAAHVHLGTSAIETLTDVLNELKRLRNWPVELPEDVSDAIETASDTSEQHSGAGETQVLKTVSVNFTVVKGGHLTNVSAETCAANVDIRLPAGVSVDEIKSEITAIIARYPQVSAEYSVLDEPNWSAPGCELVRLLQDSGEKVLGKRPVATMRVGQSDSRLYRYRGVPTVVCGLTPQNMGGADEHVSQQELYQLTTMLALTSHHFLSHGPEQS